MNTIWVLENAPACYIKLPKKEVGGGSIWDFAATACIFTELGLNPTDCFGDPLSLNNTSTTFMNQKGVVYTSSKAIQQTVCEIIAPLK